MFYSRLYTLLSCLLPMTQANRLFVNPVRTRQFHQFVVNPKQQKRRNPSADKTAFLRVAFQLKIKRDSDWAECAPKKNVRRQFSRLLLNRSGDDSFWMFHCFFCNCALCCCFCHCFFLLEKLLSSNAQCFCLFLRMFPCPFSEYRQFISAKLRLNAFNCRVRFVRFQCYKKYSQESTSLSKFFTQAVIIIDRLFKSLNFKYYFKHSYLCELCELCIVNWVT